jgi:hypothetical protein
VKDEKKEKNAQFRRAEKAAPYMPDGRYNFINADTIDSRAAVWYTSKNKEA